MGESSRGTPGTVIALHPLLDLVVVRLRQSYDVAAPGATSSIFPWIFSRPGSGASTTGIFCRLWRWAVFYLPVRSPQHGCKKSP
jgi:hypothetical protein